MVFACCCSFLSIFVTLLMFLSISPFFLNSLFYFIPTLSSSFLYSSTFSSFFHQFGNYWVMKVVPGQSSTYCVLTPLIKLYNVLKPQNDHFLKKKKLFSKEKYEIASKTFQCPLYHELCGLYW